MAHTVIRVAPYGWGEKVFGEASEWTRLMRCARGQQQRSLLTGVTTWIPSNEADLKRMAEVTHRSRGTFTSQWNLFRRIRKAGFNIGFHVHTTWLPVRTMVTSSGVLDGAGPGDWIERERRYEAIVRMALVITSGVGSLWAETVEIGMECLIRGLLGLAALGVRHADLENVRA